jgi:8-oxo-dGTP diphosphatase
MRVAVGVVRRDDHVLIALRPPNKHQGDLWEFPGGKIEASESTQDALIRELDEELGITAKTLQPLRIIEHAYPDRTVRLEVMIVSEFDGIPLGKEGQPIRWATVQELSQYSFPAANQPILKALQLPKLIAITGKFDQEQDFIERISGLRAKGAGMLQLRPPGHHSLARQQLLLKLTKQHTELPIILNSFMDPSLWPEADGLHLTSVALRACKQRPIDGDAWLGASCHNLEELQQAAKIGVDYVFLSPVLPTKSHVDAQPLGWEKFTELAQQAEIPVYALGGLQKTQLEQAQKAGALGLAAISAFWS